MKKGMFRQILALVLCFAMILPNFSSLAFAADSSASTPSTQTNSAAAFDKTVLNNSLKYSHGTVSAWLTMDGGNGLKTDAVNNKSYMQVASATTYAKFNEYCTALNNSSSYTRTDYSMSSSANVSYSRFVSKDKTHSVYAYFLKNLGEVRVVVDTHKDMTQTYSNGFAYAGGTPVTDTAMVMYALSMAPNGYDHSSTTGFESTMRNCGALIVIRMPDNSLFIHDGGDIQQWSDAACANFMQFCRDLTGITTGKVTLNTWFVSHAHSDHFNGFPRFLSLYQDQVDLKNVMYNIDDERAGSTRDMGHVMQMISTAFPGVKYYNPHTGEKFFINGIQFDVMYTHEDRFVPTSSGQQMVIDKGDEGGTYRTECFDEYEYTKADPGTADYLTGTFLDATESDFNDTSTVLKVTFPTTARGVSAEKTTILYADVTRVDVTMMNIYGYAGAGQTMTTEQYHDAVHGGTLTTGGPLATDIMMLPHHGYDAHPELVKISNSKIYLHTQNQFAIYQSNGVDTAVEGTTKVGTFRPSLTRNYLAVRDYFAEGAKEYWAGNETTYIFFTANHAAPTGTGMVKDMSASNMTVYTQEFTKAEEYTGWTIDTGVVVTGNIASGTTTETIQLYRADDLTYDAVASTFTDASKRYVFVHDKTDLALMHNALDTSSPYTGNRAYGKYFAPSSEITSAIKNNMIHKYAGYYKNSSGTALDESIYFMNSDRDALLWKLDLVSGGSGINAGAADGMDGFTGSAATTVESIVASNNTLRKQLNSLGIKTYWQVDFEKGLWSKDEPYWLASEDDDPSRIYGELQPNSDEGIQKVTTQNKVYIAFIDETAETTDTNDNGVLDKCDTCVMFYTSGTGNNVYFLTVNEDGLWGRMVFKTNADTSNPQEIVYATSTLSEHLDELKMRVYTYTKQTTSTLKYTGHTNYSVAVGTSKSTVIKFINSNFAGAITSRSSMPLECSGATPVVGSYWLDTSKLDTNKPGTYTVTAYYRNDDGSDLKLADLTINVQEVIELEREGYVKKIPAEGTTSKGASLLGDVYESVDGQGNVIEDCVLNVLVHAYGVIREDIDVNVGMLTCNANTVVHYPDGTTEQCTPGAHPNTNVPAGTYYTNLTLSYAGLKQSDTFKLTIQKIKATEQPAYPEEGSVKVDKSGKAEGVNFNNSGIAQIELSATGIPMNKGVDLIIVVDLSSSMKYGTDTVVDAINPDRRIDHMLESLNAMVTELKNNKADVRIAMSDFGDLDSYAFEKSVLDTNIYHQSYLDSNFNYLDNKTYEFYNHLNFVMSDSDTTNKSTPYEIANSKFNFSNPSYMGYVTPYVYTGNGRPTANAFQTVDTLDMTKINEKMLENVDKSIGTNYDIGLEYAYQMGYAIQQRNIAEGTDRDLVCIFMSDGAAMQYNYFSGNTQSLPWVDWLQGNADDLVSNYDYFLNNQSTALPELQTMMNGLMTALQNGTLVKPNYERSENAQRFQWHTADMGETYSHQYFYAYMDKAGHHLDWQYLKDIVTVNLESLKKLTGNANLTVEGYLGASTAEEYGALLKETKKHPELITLYTSHYYAEGNANYEKPHDHKDFGTDGAGNDCTYYTTRLINPYNEKYMANTILNGASTYAAPTSYTGNDFFEAMKIVLDRDMGWNEFLQIAEKNRDAFATETESGRKIMQNLVTKLRSQANGSTATHFTVSPYAYFYNAEGKNWWAEAIKGDTDKLYPVINKYAKDGSKSPYGYNGDQENYFSGSTTAGLDLNGKDYISGFKGLNMELYSVSFSIASEREISSEIAETVLRNIASGPNYFYSASSSEGLTQALKSITATMSRGATQGYFVDTMGADYDLFTGYTSIDGQYTIDEHTPAQKNAIDAPTIRVLEYTLDANGNRTEKFIVLETVEFNKTVPNYVQENINGTLEWVQSGTKLLKVKSDQKYVSKNVYDKTTKTYTVIPDYQELLNTDNGSQTKGLISGKYFHYNTTSNAMRIDLTGDGVGDYPLAGESFFWIVGKISQSEMVLEYQVYLTGTFDDKSRLEGVYDTNQDATLHYINYRGNNCELDTVSPSFPWHQGRVGVAFYLVDTNGNPIVDQAGNIGEFKDAVKLTRPVYSILELNTNSGTASKEIIAQNPEWLPNGYTLYDVNSQYTVEYKSNHSGSMNIKKTSTLKDSTYVISGTDEYTTAGSANKTYTFAENSYKTSDTVVWFAVKISSPLTMPDTVVVDYGLPVDIHVLANDVLFENNGTLTGVGAAITKTSATTKKTGFGTEKEGTFGKASVIGGVIHYEMTDMGMNAAEKFSYEVLYTPVSNQTETLQQYYYDTVTVIPATTIYYEDDYLNYRYLEKKAGNVDATKRENWTVLPQGTGVGNWVSVGDKQDVHQSEDRPGSFNSSNIDADNIYGYDPVYKNSSTYSLGSAMKVTVGSNNGPNQRETTAEAEFTFWGTGFDVISLTSSNTGVIVVEVFNGPTIDAGETAIKRYNVDTYYGYKYTNGKWEVDTSNSDSLYQVPVIKSEGLTYGQYTVRISVVYSTFFDHNNANKANAYDFYLDAIRIYDPANDGVVNGDTTIQDAYKQDGEYAPDYEELRNLLIKADSYDVNNSAGLASNGAVFIDGIDDLDDENDRRKYKVATYTNYGPNNEVYLAPNQSVAFKLSSVEGIKEFHIAMKKAGEDNGKNGNAIVKVYATGDNTVATANAITISTATDLYYDFTSLVGKTIVIHNAGSAGDGILSITNLKMTTSTGEYRIRDLMTVNSTIGLNALNSLIIDKAEDSFILAGANTVLGGVLDMNFFINPADLNGTDYYAEINLYAEDGVTTTTIPYADWQVRSDYLVVTQKGLAARQMADKIEVVIYNVDGTPASDVWTDSIRDYAMRILEKEDAETKAMLVDMLNYGAAAQNFFEYNMDDLANSQLTDAQKTYASDSVNCVNQQVKGENYFGSTLTLKDRIMLTMYFSNINPDMYAIVSFIDHKGVAHETRVEGSAFSEYNSTTYGVVVDELVVADGDQLVTVTVYDAEGTVVASASDSINSYAARQMGKDALYEMVAKFTNSAYAYFH